MIYATEKRITAINSPELLKNLLKEVEKEREIVLDMKNTEYISSSGLRSLLIVAKALKARNLTQLKVINASKQLITNLELVNFLEFITIE